MTINDWLEWVVLHAKDPNRSEVLLRARLVEEASVDGSEDAIQRALRTPVGSLSDYQRSLVSDIVEVIVANVLAVAESGGTFGSIYRAYEKYGDRIDGTLNNGSIEFRQLAQAFVTFDTEMDDIGDPERALVLYHAIKEAEMFLRGLFFPSVGPLRVPLSERVSAMKAVLSQYAPALDTDEFYRDNPVLRMEGKGAGCLHRLSVILMTVAGLACLTL